MPASRRILSVDVGTSFIKVAEFASTPQEGLLLTNFGVASLDLQPGDEASRPAAITATLRELLAEHRIRPGPATVSIAGQQVFSRFVKLPPVDPGKIYQIVQYEAAQNVPFPIDEVVWDFQLLSAREGGEVEAMLAAIKGDVLAEITGAITAAGLEVEIVDVATMAVYNCTKFNYPDLEGPTLVVDIGARSSDLIFIEDPHLFVRTVPVAGNSITQQIMKEFDLSFADAEQMKLAHAFVSLGGAYEAPEDQTAERVSKIVRNVMTRMHAEISRSIAFYRSQQGGSAPVRVLLTGGTCVIPYTDTFFAEKMGVPAEYLNPFQNVPVHPSVEAERIARNAFVLSQAVGTGLRSALTCPVEINLPPPQIQEDKQFRKRYPALIMAMVGLVVLVGVWAGFLHQMAKITEARSEEISLRVNQLGQINGQIAQVQEVIDRDEARLRQYQALGGKRTAWLRLFDTFRETLEPGMWIADLKATDPQGEVLAGAASLGNAEPVAGLEMRILAYNDRVATPEEFERIIRTMEADPDGEGPEEALFASVRTTRAFLRPFLRDASVRAALKEPIAR